MSTEEQEHLDKLFGIDAKSWYVGMDNSPSKGFGQLLQHLSKNGEILIDIIAVFDYEYYEQLSYCILYRSLSKLEYLEYKHKELVDNNHGVDPLEWLSSRQVDKYKSTK